MYDYAHYKENDKKELLAFMQAHPFVMLMACGKNGRIELTQVPVIVEERDADLYIMGHIARKSSHHIAVEEAGEALIVFTGAHTYISSSWYTGSPGIGSTWNYSSIHARGPVQWLDDAAFRRMMSKLALHYENGNTASPATFENLAPEYVDKMMKGIAGFELKVAELQNVFKLSQNRDEKSYDNIILELKKREGDADSAVIAAEMEQRKSKVFPS